MLSWLLGSGQSIPFDVGDEVEDYSGKTIWKLYAGSDKKDGSAVSIFACHLSADRSEVERAAARNALKRCKTIKHPYVLRFIDGMELEDGKGGHTVYIITEAVTPLETALKDGKLPEAATAWGLRSVVAVAAFLHQGGLMHGNINLSSIFTNRAGDWMLGGFELLCDPRAAGLAAFNAIKDLLPRKLQSPELTRGQFTVLEQASVGVTDSWLLGITIYEVFSGRLDRPDQLKDTARIPRQLAQDYTRLLSGNVPGRLPVAELLKNSFFDTEYCHTQEFLETLNVKDPAEKERFFVKLTSQVGMLPPAAAKYKVLPALVQNLEYGGGSARTLTLMLRVAVELTEDEFQTEVVPIITKLFGNNDRAMRVPLLENLPSIVNNIPARVLNDNIFANMASGFTDTSAQLREMTVKAVVPLAPHLVQRALAHVLRAFATLQRDEEPAIRTNTTICLGKITQYIDAASRQRVLIAAFCRALADPFAPARRAGALSLAATQAFHAPADCARKIVPAVSPLMLDPDTEVRKAALQCLQVYVAKLEGESRRMAARESGVEEEEPTDAVAVANKVATESVMESMTWVSSMLGKVGLGSVVSGADNAQPKAVDATAGSSSSGVLQPTPAPPVHQPSAPTASAALQAGTGAEAAGAASTDGWARPGINGSGLLRDADFDEALAGAPPLPTQAPPPPPTQAPPLPTQAPPPPPIQASPPQPAPLAPPVEVASVGAAVPASGSSGSLTGRKPGRLGAKKVRRASSLDLLVHNCTELRSCERHCGAGIPIEEPSDWGADDFFSDLNTPSGWSTSGLATPARGAPPPLPVQPTPPAAPMATLAASARHSAPQPQQQVRRPMPPPQHLQQRQQGSTQGSSCMQGSGLPAASLGPMTAAPRLDGPAQQVPRKQDVDPVGLLSVPRATSAQGPHGRLGAKKVDTSNDWDAW